MRFQIPVDICKTGGQSGYFNFFENIFLPANTDLNIVGEKHQEHVNFIFVYMHSIHVQCFPPRILLCKLEVKTLHNEKN